MHLRCQSPRATGQSQALDSWRDPLPHESQCLSINPAEFRHLLSVGRRGISFAGVKIRARLYFDTTIEANPATPEFGTANDTLFSNTGRSFSAFAVLS